MTLELSSRLSSQSDTAHMLLVTTEDKNQGSHIQGEFLVLISSALKSAVSRHRKKKKKKKKIWLDQLSYTSPAMLSAHSFYHARDLQQTSITRYVNAKLETFSRERKRQSVSQSKATTQQSLPRRRKGREGTDKGRELERDSREKERGQTGESQADRQAERQADRQADRQRHNNNHEYLER